MWTWITENSGGLSAIANVAMLLVWVTYLHLLLMTFLRQRRPNLILNRGAGAGLEARCLVSNMSAEPIYIQSVLVTIRTAEDQHTLAVTDMETLEEQAGERRHLSELTRQGPLDSGGFMDLGSFEALAERAARESGIASDNDELVDRLEGVEICVIGAYGPDTLLVAASREFRIDKARNRILVPLTTGTRQIRNWFKRRRIRRMLEANM